MKVDPSGDAPFVILRITHDIIVGGAIPCECGKKATGAICVGMKRKRDQRRSFLMISFCDECGTEAAAKLHELRSEKHPVGTVST